MRRTRLGHCDNDFDRGSAEDVTTPALWPPLGRPVRELDAASATLNARARALGVHKNAAGRRTWRVLVAEDNPVSQQVVTRQLMTIGLSCHVVPDGGAVFASVMTGQYDLVLMDLQMPVLDGIPATRLIRLWEKETGATPVRIIAVSADGTESDRRHCLDAGMDEHLRKPLRIGELSAVLDELRDAPASRPPAHRGAAVGHGELDAASIDALRALGNDDGTFLRELVRHFLTDGNVRLATLERAAEAGKLSVMHSFAHDLTGSSAMIGAIEVADACRAIALLRANDDASLYRNAVIRIREAYDRALPLLAALA